MMPVSAEPFIAARDLLLQLRDETEEKPSFGELQTRSNQVFA